MNPVAKAVARASLAHTVRDFLTAMYLMQEGEAYAGDVIAASEVLTVAIVVSERNGNADTPEVRVMRGAMSALLECSKRKFRWRKADSAAIDVGMKHAHAILLAADSREVRRAWIDVRQSASR